jgi:outer membrane receptor protein involved in Fe transport
MAPSAGRGVPFLFTLFLFCSQTIPAQPPSTGELSIAVKDSSGAAVASATGLLQNSASTFRRGFQTNQQGTVTLPGLPAGRYRLQITKDGFAPYASDIVLSANQRATQTVQLTIGVSSYDVSVVSATPLAGLDRPLSEIPAPVQTATSRDLDSTGSLDLSAFLNRRMNNVFLNEIQGNPLQPDLNYRGYTASPLLGTPQGISIYLDGVRLNQPFGDVVSWDLIPRVAISEMALIPGSNPLFGLNTLGGSLSIRTKDGNGHPGTSLQFLGGSFGRKMTDFEHGGSRANGRLHWFLANTMLFEDGWRETSPTNVRQFFGKIGSQRERTSVNLTAAYANNALIGNGLQDHRLLLRDYSSVYTKPDVTTHRAPFLNLSVLRSLSPAITFSGNAYFRYIETGTLNGDINEDSLDQSVYQPNAAERAALAAAGYSGFPTAGENALNTPFPKWRCIANALLRDEPAEKCNGLLNRGFALQRNYGISGQMSWFKSQGPIRNQFTLGAAYDGNSVGFRQSSELGYLNPDRSVTGVGAFGDGITGGEEDGEPYDTRVDLSGRIHSGAVYLTDTVTLHQRLSVTFSGRLNRTTIDNLDRIRPLAGTGSLTGRHVFTRFNPAVGATYRVGGAASVYASYTEGNRAPTSIELGCADPEAPCKLPNAMAGDPPLQQVLTRTFEAGIRGSAERSLRWSAGWFHTANRNDILFVASEQTGFGYFKNFARTLRQGMEVDTSLRLSRLTLGGGYTLLDATFRSREEVNGTGNSTNSEAQEGVPGTEGSIRIEPGNRIPLMPRHLAKVYADMQITSKWLMDLGVIAVSNSFVRGNENNLHRPDDRYYLGSGTSPGYAVVNLGTRYRIHPRVDLVAQVNNLFNRVYYSGGQLGPSGFTAAGNFVARPFAAIGQEFPLQGVTFFAPGAPRGAWAGLRLRF